MKLEFGMLKFDVSGHSFEIKGKDIRKVYNKDGFPFFVADRIIEVGS